MEHAFVYYSDNTTLTGNIDKIKCVTLVDNWNKAPIMMLEKEDNMAVKEYFSNSEDFFGAETGIYACFKNIKY